MRIIDENYLESSKKRFFKYVEKKQDSCWLWSGALSTGGYGRFVYKRKIWPASRMIWTWEFGEIPDKMMVCHKCDEPACVNPSHLFLGTQKDNMQDMLNKGRWEYHRGAMKKPLLKSNEVIEIRKMIEDGVNIKEICVKFSLRRSTIENIKYGRSWKHVVS